MLYDPLPTDLVRALVGRGIVAAGHAYRASLAVAVDRDVAAGVPTLHLCSDGCDGVAWALAQGAADADWIGTPPAVLAARIHALARRVAATASGGDALVHGDLTIDRVARRVARAGRPLALLPREYALLLCLAQHADRTVSQEVLRRTVWGLHFDPGTNVVAVHVSRLRAKLDRGFAWPMLLTERHLGYRLATRAGQAADAVAIG